MNGSWRPPPWWAPFATRLRFITEVQHVADGAVQVRKPTPRHGGGFAVAFTVTPVGVPSRIVRIEFWGDSPETPRVFVDGPATSPHRYGDGSLCMWFPTDPPDLHWSRRDGAASLVGCTALHLVREQWWRETGEWVGPEAPHATPPKRTGRAA